jgi:hypothetical protein
VGSGQWAVGSETETSIKKQQQKKEERGKRKEERGNKKGSLNMGKRN